MCKRRNAIVQIRSQRSAPPKPAHVNVCEFPILPAQKIPATLRSARAINLPLPQPPLSISLAITNYTIKQNPLISRRLFVILISKPSFFALFTDFLRRRFESALLINLIVPVHTMPRATSKRKAPSSTSASVTASDVVSTRPGIFLSSHSDWFPKIQNPYM